MKIEKAKFAIIFLILATIIGNTACSSSKTIAQEPKTETLKAETAKPQQSPTPVYQKPKRVSKDIILEESKEVKQKKSKKAK